MVTLKSHQKALVVFVGLVDSLTNTEKKILERVINIVETLDIDNSDAVIEAILNNFSAQ